MLPPFTPFFSGRKEFLSGYIHEDQHTEYIETNRKLEKGLTVTGKPVVEPKGVGACDLRIQETIRNLFLTHYKFH